MDFFARQEEARKSTAGLIFVQVLAVIAISLSIHSLVALGLCYLQDPPLPYGEMFMMTELMPYTVGIPIGIILLCMLWKIYKLNQGGAAVAESVGGVEVKPNTRNFHERRLLNVVEEMALASGVRIPRVYVLRGEEGINAFAAGYSTKDAAVAVTEGALASLNREELQAVIGHEFSHILNGDMRLNIWLIGVLGGILGLSMTGMILMKVASGLMSAAGRRRGKDNGAAAGLASCLAILLLGLITWLVGLIGVFFGRLVQSAVSRKREHLADALSVQFTRNPLALSHALQIIGANARRGNIGDGHASEISHMFFVSGIRSLFATHPPLEQRIQWLDPTFNGDFRPAAKTLNQRLERYANGEKVSSEEVRKERSAHAQTLGAALSPDQAAATMTAVAAAAVSGQERAESAARKPTTVSAVKDCGERSNSLPADLVAEIGQNVVCAEACLYATTLSGKEVVRKNQMALLGQRGPALLAALETCVREVSGMNFRAKRAISELSLHTLSVESESNREAIADIVDQLSRADGEMDSYEFALARMVHRRFFADRLPPRQKTLPGRQLAGEAGVVLASLAWFGGRNKEMAAKAFGTGAEYLRPAFGPIQADTSKMPSLDELDRSLARLVQLTPIEKAKLLSACRAVVEDDGIVSEVEENMIAAYADGIRAEGYSAVA